MKLHEKSLELNITHELLNLADSWFWFLTDIPLWRYWRPRYRLPFVKYPRSTSAGFHINTEGREDPTGNSGGGFDVRIRAGNGSHLLFIQFKKGDLCTTSPGTDSEFEKAPHNHFVFEINGTTTNQHFTLRKLANGIGALNRNAVVYALPLIKDMPELESKMGRLVRHTKFISIADLDNEATKAKVTFTRGQQHNFRVDATDMNRCEVNFFFFFFAAPDRAPELIADIIATRFQKTLSYFLREIEKNYKQFELFPEYIPFGIRQAFIQYLRYLLHYFEVSPSNLQSGFPAGFQNYYYPDEFEQYLNAERDMQIINSVFNALAPFGDFIFNLDSGLNNVHSLSNLQIPRYEPSFLIPLNAEDGINISFGVEDSQSAIEGLSYIVV